MNVLPSKYFNTCVSIIGGSLVKYLKEVSLLTDVDRWNESDKSITMMTIHSAKGFKFDNVSLSALEDGQQQLELHKV